jgi:nifR3 family TIM-barrel protein
MLRNVPLMLEITREVVRAVDVPVTAKTRLGWDCNNKIIVELAEQLQDCGIQALTIHGRTRSQMYNGEADWTLIGEVKNNPRMTIPIIGNGDVTTPQRVKECFDRYGVDGVMVGRASIGAPWIFREMKQYLITGEVPAISNEEKMALIRRQIDESIDRIDEYRGILHIRRHLAATPLFKGIRNFRPTRIAMLQANTRAELEAILDHIENDILPNIDNQNLEIDQGHEEATID